MKIVVTKMTAEGEQVTVSDTIRDIHHLGPIFDVLDERLIDTNKWVLEASNLAKKYKDPQVMQAIHEVFDVIYNHKRPEEVIKARPEAFREEG
jgi:hypothetical protein